MKQDNRDSWIHNFAPGAVLPSPDQQIVAELVKVLEPHPGGLRRWSVMRAIRAERGRTARPVSLKFEAEIERVFKSACGNAPDGLFYRPEGKAGEVWAIRTQRLHATPQAANAPDDVPIRHAAR